MLHIVSDNSELRSAGRSYNFYGENTNAKISLFNCSKTNKYYTISSIPEISVNSESLYTQDESSLNVILSFYENLSQLHKKK